MCSLFECYIILLLLSAIFHIFSSCEDDWISSTIVYNSFDDYFNIKDSCFFLFGAALKSCPFSSSFRLHFLDILGFLVLLLLLLLLLLSWEEFFDAILERLPEAIDKSCHTPVSRSMAPTYSKRNVRKLHYLLLCWQCFEGFLSHGGQIVLHST